MRINCFLVLFFLTTALACNCGMSENNANNGDIHISNVNIDSLDIIASLKLSSLDSKDSVFAYINLCTVMADSLLSWQNTAKAAKYAMLASSKEYALQTDSGLKNKIVSICFKTEFDQFHYTYSDTCLALAEFVFRNSNSLTMKSTVSQDIGIMYMILGDKEKAGAFIDSSYKLRLYLKQNDNTRPMARKNNAVAASIINKTILYTEYRQYDSAVLYIMKGLELDSLESKRIAYLKSSLAEAYYHSGKKVAAFPLINESLDLLYKEDITDEDIQTRIRTVLNLQAALLTHEGMYRQSNDCLLNSFAILNHRFYTRYTAKTLIAISGNFLNLHNADSAIFYAHEALRCVTHIDSVNIFSLPSVQDVYAENAIYESADALADAFIVKYKITNDIKYADAAIKCFALSFATENKLLNYYSYDDSKLALLTESRTRSEKSIALCYRLFQQTKDAAWAQKAFEFAEGNKATVLLQSLKQNMAASRLLQKDSTYQKLQSLKLQTAYTEKSMAETKQTDTAGNNLLVQKLNRLENEILLSQSLLIKNNPAYKTILLQKDSVNIPLIQEKIIQDDTTALLEFFWGDSAQYAFVVSKHQATQLIQYNPATISSVKNYLSFFTKEDSIATNPKGFAAAASTLFIQLGLKEISSQYRRIIIIPDADFSFLPFESLLTENTTTASLKNLTYLIKQCNISYGFSASTLLKQTEQKQNNNNFMLAMAPVFTQGQKGLTPLPGTASELNTVQGEMPEGNYFINEAATLSAFRQYSSNAAYIHLATHAFANTANAEPAIEFADSTLFLNELSVMPLHANLAVLSACETGIGRLEKSEGAMSMARGFYYAGVPHIITSLWQVNDESTKNLYKNFYASLSRENYATAFHISKIKYLQTEQSSEKYSPYYWAGLIFIGNNDSADTGSSWWWVLLPVCVLLIYLAGKVGRKKK